MMEIVLERLSSASVSLRFSFSKGVIVLVALPSETTMPCARQTDQDGSGMHATTTYTRVYSTGALVSVKFSNETLSR